MNSHPSQLTSLFQYSQNHDLSFLDINLSIDKEDLLSHFNLKNLNSDEFVIWGELTADNIILSWCKDNIHIDIAPIAIIDSEASPVSVIADNPIDFIKLLPLSLRRITSITNAILRNESDQDGIIRLRNKYGAEYVLQSYQNSESEEFKKFMEWYNENDYSITDLIPFELVNKAITNYPDFHERMKQVGLPF